MEHERIVASDALGAGLIKTSAADEQMLAIGAYTVQHIRDGEVIFEETFKNLVTNGGKIDLLDKYFAGSAYTATFYMGFVDGTTTPVYNAADTMASHTGWTENAGYVSSTRPAISWTGAAATGGGAGTAGTGTKASAAIAFAINAVATVAGVFITTNNAKSGSTGILYSVGSFTGGNRGVQPGDSLSVTWSGSV